jgi:hypothetical protein
MGDRLLDFTIEWLIALPMSLCDMSKYKLVRVLGIFLGIFLLFPWVIATILPFTVLLIVFAMWMLIEEA